jgi:hypothetical protein
LLDTIDHKWLLAGLSAVISVGTIIYYARTILIGKVKPHMFTWLIWGIVTAVVAVTQISSKGGPGSLLAVIVTINCFIVAGLAYHKGDRDFPIFDKACLVGCVIAIALWPMMKAPLLSLVIVTIIDTIGFIPTLRKSYKNPQEENMIVFFFYGLAYLISVFALNNVSWLTGLYPIAIGCTALAMVVFLAVRRYQLNHHIFHERHHFK